MISGDVFICGPVSMFTFAAGHMHNWTTFSKTTQKQSNQFSLIVGFSSALKQVLDYIESLLETRPHSTSLPSSSATFSFVS